MKLVFAMLLSVGIKALAAILEIIIQILIANYAGVSGYGDYTFYVSMIECIYFCVFSGSIKINTFYLSIPALKISQFKKHYLIKFVLPIACVLLLIFGIKKNQYGLLVTIILLVYYAAYDQSSIFFSRGYQLPALIGEYVVGRIVMLVGLVVFLKMKWMNGVWLLILYGIQFVAMVLWFGLFHRMLPKGRDEINVSITKLLEYQKSDIANALISYSPAILQYIFGGAFSAGFTGIVSLVKKFINFISGPTAKVFLPEFSRLYREGNRAQMQKSYLMIVRIQMLFGGTIGAALIGFPYLILNLFSPELQSYTMTFTLASVCLLMVAGIGPAGGLLQMTDNERICNMDQWISIGVMATVCVFMRNNPLFAVYGLCAQSVVEGILKYCSVCKWFGKQVIPVYNYLLMWMPILLGRAIVDQFRLQSSFAALLICVAAVGLWNFLFVWKDPMVQEAVRNGIKNVKGGFK